MVAPAVKQRSSALRWIYLGFIGHTVALILFDFGMFPVKPVTTDTAAWSDYGPEPGTTLDLRYGRVFKKVVVMLIDGIRTDVVWSDRKLMPFTCSLLDNGKGVGFVTLAQSPTVTLPRIKAILTGSVPLFSDAILNVQESSGISPDNLLTYAKREHGAHVVAYGDNIWGTLFPERDAFLRSEWVVSFFVSDFVHVDVNVTKHVPQEMQKSDWDILVLHYLGLDHIGHFEGPTSSHVPGKLLEMDGVVKQIYNSLDADSLLLVLGDHGTGDAGGHGGSSASEVRTPAMFFSPRFESDRFAHVAGSHAGVVEQIDLASTLAALLGVPIPKSNMGKMLTGLLEHLYSHDPLELLRCLAANTRQLLGAVNASSLSSSRKDGFLSRHAALVSLHGAFLKRAHEGMAPSVLSSQSKDIVLGYGELLRSISSMLVQTSVSYDTLAMAAALYLLVSIPLLCGVRVASHGIFRALSSNYPLLLLSCLFSLFLQVLACTSLSLGQSAWLFSFSLWTSPILVLLCATTTLNIGVVIVVVGSWLQKHCDGLQLRLRLGSIAPASVGIVAGTCCQLALLGASSFVEEEHQVWYFLTTSFLLSMVIQKRLKASSVRSSSPHGTARMELVWCCASVFLFRVARSWNQTGDKWLHLPDISSWMAGESHLFSRSVLGILSLAVVGCSFLIRTSRRSIPIWHLFLLLPGLCFVYGARSAMKQFYLPTALLGFLSSDGYVESHIVYFLCILLVLMEMLKAAVLFMATKPGHVFSAGSGLQTSYSAYLLLMCLLSRPQNVAVMAVMTVQHIVFDLVVWPALSSWQVGLSAMWMAFAGYYLQGNSNALSKIDLTAGYVGMQDFQPARVFLLITLSVWASVLTWLMAAFGHVARSLEHRQPVTSKPKSHATTGSQSIPSSSLEAKKKATGSENAGDRDLSVFIWTVMLHQMAIGTVVTVVSMAMRQHIMVWTVFSPKLLIGTSQSIHVLCLVTIMMVLRWVVYRDM